MSNIIAELIIKSACDDKEISLTFEVDDPDDIDKAYYNELTSKLIDEMRLEDAEVTEIYTEKETKYG